LTRTQAIGAVLALVCALGAAVVWLGARERERRARPDAPVAGEEHVGAALVEAPIAGARDAIAPIASAGAVAEAPAVTGARAPEDAPEHAPRATLVGRVLAADTLAPVAGARVLHLHDGCAECESREATSGADGRFELAGVPRDEKNALVIDAAGFAQLHRRLRIGADETRVETDFPLERGLVLSGRVVDLETGVGLGDARIQHDGPIEVDAEGWFRARIVPRSPDEPVRLRVSAPGHCDLSVELARETPEAPLELRLLRGAVVAGVVRDDAGRPIAKAWVDVDVDHAARMEGEGQTVELAHFPGEPLPRGWRYELEPGGVRAHTDADGRFRIAEVVPWSSRLVIAAGAKGHEPRRQPLAGPVGGPGEATWIELVLPAKPPTFRVSGKLSLNGAPLRTGATRVHWKGRTRSDVGPTSHGRFWIDVEPGPVAFRVEVDGLPAEVEGAEFTLAAEAGAELEHDVHLRLATRSISGSVRFDDGSPAAGATLEASCPLAGTGDAYRDRLHLVAQAGDDGAFSLDVPDLARAFRLEARLHAAEDAREGVAPGASDVELVLARSGALLIRLRDAETDGLLLAGDSDLQWKPVTEEEFRSVLLRARAADQDGWYELRLPSGLVDLRLEDEFYPCEHLPVLVEGVRLHPDVPQRVELRVSSGLTLDLRLAADQAPFPRDHILVLVEEALWEGARFDAERNAWEGVLDGAIFQRFVGLGEHGSRIRCLTPGTYRFKCFPDDVVIEPDRIELVEGGIPPVLVKWRERR
jgi:hypothetical protein